MLRTKQKLPITKAISLGLGSLVSKDQSRRIKQLTIFLAIIKQLEASAAQPIKVYAQDPAFTKVDELFLESLGIRILRTPSASILGEAERHMDMRAMVYSPFLTIQAYRNVLESCNVGILVGDDFNALRMKWPKSTSEHDDVNRLIKRELMPYQKRSFNQGSKLENFFWEKDDKMFPMALYRRSQEREQGIERSPFPDRTQDAFNHLGRTISAKL